MIPNRYKLDISNLVSSGHFVLQGGQHILWGLTAGDLDEYN